MEKLFNVDFRTGSAIDTAFNVAPTFNGTDNYIEQTEKGLALRSVSSDELVYTAAIGQSFTGDITVEVWWRCGDDASSTQYVLYDANAIKMLVASNRLYFRSDGVTNTLSNSNEIQANTWYHFIVNRSSAGVTNFWINGDTSGALDQAGGTPVTTVETQVFYAGLDSNRYIPKITIYKGLSTANDRARMYNEFLCSKPIIEIKSKIRYPKPTDASREYGIVAAYNMMPVGDTLIDISGNNGWGPVEDCSFTDEGLVFNGVSSNIACLNFGLSWELSGTQTIVGIAKPGSLTGEDQIILNLGKDTSNRFGVGVDTLGYLCFSIYDGSFENKSSPYTVENQWVTFVAINNNKTTTFYVNGQTVTGTVNVSPTSGLLKIGMRNQSQWYNGIIRELKFYNYCFTAQQAKDYHNKWARQVALQESFSDAGADGQVKLPREWIAGTGSFIVGELAAQDSVLPHLDKGTKYLECTSAGTVAMPCNIAYGTWEFDFYREGTGGDAWLQIVSTTTGDRTTSSGYYFYISTSESISLVRYVAGAYLVLSTTAAAFSGDTWYRARIKRTLDGVFTLYVKGGSEYGNTWTLLGSGAAGSNPTTGDNAVTYSNYIVIDSFTDVGMRVANIKVTKGVLQ